MDSGVVRAVSGLTASCVYKGENMQRRNGILKAVVCASAIVAGAGLVQAQSDTELRLVSDAQPPTLDPHFTNSGIMSEISRNIYETLLSLDANREIQPGLASAWEVSEDGTVVTFSLRDGVTFHNGAPLTTDDVVASLERWSRLSIPGKQSFSEAKWTALDDKTVELRVPQASYKIVYALANYEGQIAAIMPKSVLEAAGDDKAVDEIVGTNSYKVVEWIPDQHIVFERFSEYNNVGTPASLYSGDRTPEFDKIVYAYVPDDATRLYGLKTGQYDVNMVLPFDNYEDVVSDSNLTVGTYSYQMLNLVPNKARGFFMNPDARKALYVGLDRESIMFGAFGDDRFFELNHHLMLKHEEALWNTEIGKAGYGEIDIPAAKKHLEAAGYAGEELTIISNRTGASYNAAVVLQQQLQGLGLNVLVEVYDNAALFDVRSDKDRWDLYVVFSGGRSDPSNFTFLSPTASSGWVADPKFDEIIARFNAAKSLDDARGLYDDMQSWVLDYVPVIKFGEVKHIFATTKAVQIADDAKSLGPNILSAYKRAAP